VVKAEALAKKVETIMQTQIVRGTVIRAPYRPNLSNRLLLRAESINMDTIRKLLQEEGIYASLFPRKVKPEKPPEQKDKDEKAKTK
jgi:hypothetical protein